MKPFNNKVRAEILIQTLSIAGGYSVHVFFHRWDIALVVTLALECFLHFVAMMWQYGQVLDTIAEWVHDSGNSIESGNPIEDIKHIRKNAIPMHLVLPAPNDWPFDELFREAVLSFRNRIELISTGDCTIEMEDILDVSLRVSTYVEPGAFATALEENLDIFDTDRGKTLLTRQYEAATRLAKSSGREVGFTRLFVFDALDAVTWNHLKLLEHNAENAIEVLVAEKTDVAPVFKKFDREERMDFGLWRSDLLMEIWGPESERRLHVTKRHEDLQTTKALIKALREKSLSYQEFLRRFKSPRNIAQWSTEPQRALNLDPPDGPHHSDCETMFNIACSGLDIGDRIAVYGLTSSLITKAGELANTLPERKVITDIVDARHYVPTKRLPNVEFVRANWLDWVSPTLYSAVIADDILCNLTYWQTPIFFDALSRSLRPRGILVMRATAKFYPGLINPSWGEILSELRRFDPADSMYERGLNLEMLTPGAVYEAAWPTLHSQPFYDERSRSFRLGDWNKHVREESGIGVNFRNHLTFQRDLRMTSMPYLELHDLWQPHFRVSRREIPAYSLWEADPSLSAFASGREIARRFHEYYRIIVLERI